MKKRLTPILAAVLASEGMRFTDGHSSSGICTPSRFALLTGYFHERLTFEHHGRPFRLTDVAGKVVDEIIA